MMTTNNNNFTIKVRRSVLKQLRELAGYATPQMVFKEYLIDVERLETVKSNTNVDTDINTDNDYVNININVLRELSRIYGFPLSAFFLSDVSETLDDINRKFTTPLNLFKSYAKDILRMYRLSNYYRDEIDIYNDKRQEPMKFTLNDNPREVAGLFKDILFKNNIKSTKEIEDTLLSTYSIYIFRFNISDRHRMLVLADKKPYIIAINHGLFIDTRDISSISKEEPEEIHELWYILHGFAHILLRHSSYCEEGKIPTENKEELKWEDWCCVFADSLANKSRNTAIKDIIYRLEAEHLINKFGLHYLKALDTLNYSDYELSDILDTKIKTVEILRGMLYSQVTSNK